MAKDAVSAHFFLLFIQNVFFCVCPFIIFFLSSSRQQSSSQSGTVHVKMLVPIPFIGRLIGKGGVGIQALQAATGVKPDVDKEPLGGSTEKVR